MTPFEILGIQPTTSEADIKRAYARKLKTTRPDEDPEGFQALHEARNEALDWARYQREWGDDGEDDDDGEGAEGISGFGGFGGMTLNSGLLTVLAMEARRPGSANQHVTEELERAGAARDAEAAAGAAAIGDADGGKGGVADATAPEGARSEPEPRSPTPPRGGLRLVVANDRPDGSPPPGAASGEAPPADGSPGAGSSAGGRDAEDDRDKVVRVVETGGVARVDADAALADDSTRADDGDDDLDDADIDDDDLSAPEREVLDDVLRRLEQCLDHPWQAGDLGSWTELARRIEDRPLSELPLMQYRVLVALERRFKDPKWRLKLAKNQKLGEGLAMVGDVFGWGERDRVIYDTIDAEPADDLIALIRAFRQSWFRPGHAGYVRAYRGDVAVIEPTELTSYFDGHAPVDLIGYYQRSMTAGRWLSEFSLTRAITAPFFLGFNRMWAELGFWLFAVGLVGLGTLVPALHTPLSGGTTFASVASGLLLAIHVAVGAYGPRMVLAKAVRRVEAADERGLSDPSSRRAFLGGHGPLPHWMRLAVGLAGVGLLGLLIIGPERLSGSGGDIPMDPAGIGATAQESASFMAALMRIEDLAPQRLSEAADALQRGEVMAAVTEIESATAAAMKVASRRSQFHALYGALLGTFHLLGPDKAGALIERMSKPLGLLAAQAAGSGLPIRRNIADPIALDYLHDVYAVCALAHYRPAALVLLKAGDEAIWARIGRISSEDFPEAAKAAMRELLARPECQGRQAALLARLEAAKAK